MGALQTVRTTATNFDSLSQLIANPPTDRPIAGAIGNGGQRLCQAYGNLNLGAQLLTGPGRPILDLLCKPYFDGSGFDAPTEAVPFTGGQCPGTAYTAFIETVFNPGAPVGGSLALIGPVSSLVILETPSGNPQNPVLFQLQAVDSQGTQTTQGAPGAAADRQNLSIALFATSGPDNCGDPPGVLEPGNNPPPAPPPFPPGEEPGLDPDGQPFFFVPDIESPTGEPILLPDEPLGDVPPASPSNPAGGDGLPGDPDAVGPEAGAVNGGEDGEEIDFGEPPEGRVWLGCIVETMTDTRVGNIPGTAPKSTVWPSVRGNVALRYGSLFGKSERINSKFHDIFRPNTSLIVTGCFIQAQSGSTSRVFPISGITCPVNPCET